MGGTMSKKHYILIGTAIREHNKYAKKKDAFTIEHLHCLCQVFHDDNHAFMEARWLDYIAGKGTANGKRI